MIAENTLVLTKNGWWKKAKDITKDDLVAQYNLETQEITFTHPLSIIKEKVDKYLEYDSYFSKEKVSILHNFVIDGKLKDIKQIIDENGKNEIREKQKTYAGYFKEKEGKFDNEFLLLLFFLGLSFRIHYTDYQGGKFIATISSGKRLDAMLSQLNYPYKKGYVQCYMLEVPIKDEVRQWFECIEANKLKWQIAFMMTKENVLYLLENLRWVSRATMLVPSELQPHFVSWNYYNLKILQTACALNGIPAVMNKKWMIPVLFLYDELSHYYASFKYEADVKEEEYNMITIETPEKTLVVNNDDKIVVTGC